MTSINTKVVASLLFDMKVVIRAKHLVMMRLWQTNLALNSRLNTNRWRVSWASFQS